MDKYQGRDVLGSAIEVRNAAGGLHDALALDPAEYPIGAKLFVLYEVEVKAHRHDPIKKTDALTLVHIANAERGRIVSGDGYREALDETTDLVVKAREEAEGVTRLDTALTEKRDELAKEHAGDLHVDNLMPGCPDCDAIIMDEDDGEPDPLT